MGGPEERALLIFIKNPVPGKVKTRLAATVGEDKAMVVYQELLRHTREVAATVPASRLLYYSHWIESADEWPADVFQKLLQQGEDLGARMETAFRRALTQHRYALIIGSDCASLTSGIIAQGFERLRDHDCVIGPALDGGYYLLGMKQVHSTLFRNIAWSTESVFAHTMQAAAAANLTVYQLPELSDIDYEEDWKKYGWPIEGFDD